MYMSMVWTAPVCICVSVVWTGPLCTCMLMVLTGPICLCMFTLLTGPVCLCISMVWRNRSVPLDLVPFGLLFDLAFYETIATFDGGHGS